MHKFTAPIRFEPFLRPMVWGGDRLASVLGKSLPSKDDYGESWEISDHPLHQSVVADGPLHRQSLSGLIQEYGPSLLGNNHAGATSFPWLIKFLDANDWLSVQVHPNDELAAQLWPGERGKTEAWYVVDAAPESRIYAGLRPGVTEQNLRTALSKGSVEDCLYSFPPQAGDFVYFSAGTVHAVGGGVLIAEVQQTSDATFRLFDWNRVDEKGNSRELHIEQSIKCIDWKRGPVHPVNMNSDETPGGRFTSLVDCPFFHIEFIRGDTPIPFGNTDRMAVVMLIQGRGEFSTGQRVVQGQTWLLPAGLPPVEFHPNNGPVSVLRVT